MGRPPSPPAEPDLTPSTTRYWVEGEEIVYPHESVKFSKISDLEAALAEVGLTLHMQAIDEEGNTPRRRRFALRLIPITEVALEIFDLPGFTRDQLIDKIYKTSTAWTKESKKAAIARFNVAVNRLRRERPGLIKAEIDPQAGVKRYYPTDPAKRGLIYRSS